MNEEVVSIPKFHNPHPDLIDWFQKRLILEHERKDFIQKGEKPTNSFHNRLKSSGARKTELLDELIFPAMTNLIFFFEALEISPTLKKLFEKDLIKLLDPRFVKGDVKSREMGMNTSGYYAFRWNNFTRLVSNAVSLDVGTKKAPIDNFRISLIYQLQGIIRYEVGRLTEREYGWSGQITKSVTEDIDKVMGWLAFLAKSVSEQADKEPDRVIGFGPITYSNKGPLSQLRY